jgi:hypothetical protein
LLRDVDQVVERMVDFVAKGQLIGRWFHVSARVAIATVTMLNATNVVFMALFSHWTLQGLSRICAEQVLVVSRLQGR